MSNARDEKWMEMYELAKQYYEQNGNLQISINYKINNINLGKWISHQREYYKDNTLSQKKIILLESINMIWNIGEYLWKENYQIAEKYFNKNGNLLIPREYEVNSIKLGLWISNQRKDYKEGTNPLFTQERINLLNKIGMVWNVLEFQWQENYKLAKNFFEKNGNLLIPKRYEINNICLGSWIQKQRRKYNNTLLEEEKRNKKIGTLSQEQIDLLESIGMVWSIK